jgi:Skp family chaperone for outer membrane proteins
MDATILSLLPTGGVATVLVIVIVYLLRQNHADRKQYRDDVAAIEARHTTEQDKREKAFAASNAAVQDEMKKLREEVNDALAELENERRKRWAAEDVAAEERRLRLELQARLDERQGA